MRSSAGCLDFNIQKTHVRVRQLRKSANFGFVFFAPRQGNIVRFDNIFAADCPDYLSGVCAGHNRQLINTADGQALHNFTQGFIIIRDEQAAQSGNVLN